MLEKMRDFFEKRLSDYDSHMINDIEGAKEFYPFTAQALPMYKDANVLDLGCGTGLELSHYFALNPDACVLGIDLSQKMLDALKLKFPENKIKLICDSYFDRPFGEKAFDAAVSVESLHHFTLKQKTALYTKLCKALKDDGYFILTDYFALSESEEREHFEEFSNLKKQQGIDDGEFYHYDTPLTLEHEMQALFDAGFSCVEILNRWGATFSVCAKKDFTVIGKTVKVTVDRPKGSFHPKYKEMCYQVNYGYAENIFAPDGKEQDIYILGVSEPLKEFTGKVVAVVKRVDDCEDKWIVAPENMTFSKEEISKQTMFQEQYFKTEILM